MVGVIVVIGDPVFSPRSSPLRPTPENAESAESAQWGDIPAAKAEAVAARAFITLCLPGTFNSIGPILSRLTSRVK